MKIEQSKIKYKKDFDFKIKSDTTPQEILIGCKIAKSLTLHNIYTQKLIFFAQELIISEHAKLNSESLGHLLFVLGHSCSPLPQINDKLIDLM